MAFLTIKPNQGITQAIAEKLNLTKKYTPDVWNQVVGLVEAESQQKNIFDESKGKDIDSKDYHSNYVVNAGDVQLSDNTWNRICKILGKENKCTNITNQPSDTSPSVEKTTNLAKAFNLIVRAVKNNTLGGGELPPGFREALIKAYGCVDDSQNTPTVAEYAFSLLVETQKNLGNTTEMNADMARRAFAGVVSLNIDGDLYGKKCSEYKNSTVVESFIKENNILDNTIQGTVEQKPPTESLKSAVKKATEKAIDYLANSNIEFDAPDGNKIKSKDVVKFLKAVDYETCPIGAARADSAKAQILVNTNNEVKDITNFTKVLIHEALHLAFNSVQDTQKEERLCERQAICVAADMVGKGMLDKTQIEDYGINYSDLTDETLDRTLDIWINQNYSSRPIDLSGKVTINGKVIESGDEVFINGQKQGVIGNNNFYLDSPDGKQTYMQNIGNGTQVLSNTDSGHGKVEIKHDGVVVYTAYIQ